MMGRNIFVAIIVILFVLTNGVQLSAQQCKRNNTMFKAGEELVFDLYFKYGMLNTKAGFSKISVSNARYDGKEAYKMVLHAESTGAVEKLFSLNDTLTSYMTKDLVPLAFLKNAREGGDYTVETIKYTYTPNGVSLRTTRVKNGRQRFDVTFTSKDCIYDFLSIVFYARTLDYSKLKKGTEARVEFMSGKRKVMMIVEHHGTERIKANNGKKYNCIKLSLNISDDAFDSRQEAMKVYLTDDNNCMPVKIESKLKIGSTRAVLKSIKGNRHPLE